MSEKQKGKSHPFAGHLRPTEEVLWMSGETQTPIGAQIRSNAISIVGFIGAVIAVSILNAGNRSIDPKNLMIGAGGITFVVLLLVGLYYGGSWLMGRFSQPERIYAITNERLLYRKKAEVVAAPLESLPAVSLFLGDGSKGTLSFGALFPMWPDVDNAEEVKRLMEEAREKRQQDLAV